MKNIKIRMTNVSKTYSRNNPENRRAIDAINLEMHKGEALAIIGASGSGKSTLLNIMGMLSEPTEGQYFIDGIDTGLLNDAKRAELRNMEIGYVFQNFRLIEERNVFENVMTPLLFDRDYAHRRQKSAVMEALDRVGMADMAMKRTNLLSGGERQRVAIARAIVKPHGIILADEPTGQLDSKNAAAIMKLLSEINAGGSTLILVTHDMSLAQCLKRRITLKDGKLVADNAKLIGDGVCEMDTGRIAGVGG